MDLTPTQRRALQALDWLYDTGDQHRRTGRTTLIALSYLRRILVFNANSRGGWIEVEDHFPGDLSLDRHMVNVILAMARDIGCDGAIEVHANRHRIRLASNYRISQETLNAVTDFGDLPEDRLGVPEHVRAEMNRVHTARPVTPAPPAPEPEKRSLWDHLAED